MPDLIRQRCGIVYQAVLFLHHKTWAQVAEVSPLLILGCTNCLVKLVPTMEFDLGRRSRG
jgi:hypothetical protein